MHNDLSIPQTRISRFARRLLVMTSVILAIGLTGAVFARAEQQRARLVWLGRGVVMSFEPAQVGEVESRSTRKITSTDDAQPAAAKLVPSTPNRKRTFLMEVTAYCPCTKCCGPAAQGLTASGRHVSYNDGRFVAADTRVLPFGTKLRIPGYDNDLPVEVIDRGGAIKGHKLDVFFPTHQQALHWGRQKLLVTIDD